ncbi:hypothetical protein [Micromonospora auratinigra]|uniref:Rho termination factor, N-terminal domain n=1 Tax=Micromonospora auratinigra TaxID=261654 RepID=A0A1A8ZWW2_9ACTN|nr:hypothetical protein [Micromonospora auratinigra]SBT48328.1 hypothetical protein GA0070611_4036 [Micromonospora auratinigra]
MAQRNSSGRGTTAARTKRQPGNQTANTPNISESEISRMKVDDLRGQLRRRGVGGISAMRKPELVKTLARTLRAEGRGGAARRSTGPSGRASATKKTTTARRTTAARRSAPSRAKAAPAAKATGARARAAAPARKATTARKAAPARRAASSRAAPRGTAATSTPVRTGRSSSRSVSSSQQITSLADRPERPGRSLVTSNHEVIRRWARARGAKPATIAGTERAGRPGVLTFNIPGYRESSRIREITWDDWFRTFDARRLNLIYQEQLRDGRQSNFFRTENPNREDG